jgi:HD-GYP domain-containing protein (c-di-GMP phosphodiesterase class II)
MPNLLQTCIPLPLPGRKAALRSDCSEPCLSGCLNLHQFAEALGNAVDAKDPLLFNHSHDVAETGRILACGMGLDPTAVELVHIAGHLHDIGKIGIPDAVLKKQGALDRNEWRWMKRHPEIGAEIVRPVAPFNTPGGVADIILGHHEHYDGSGYPQRLRGEHIPLGARIVAVADTLSALLRNRPYRRGCSFEQALAEIRRSAGSQFDPAVVRILGMQRDEIRETLSAPEAFLARRFSERIAGPASAAA